MSLRIWLAAAVLLGIISQASAQIPPTQCVTTAAAGGTANAMTIPNLPCSVTTTLVILTAVGANSSGGVTLQMGAMSPMAVVKGSGTPLLANDILGPGYRMMLTTDGTKWWFLNPATSFSNVALVADLDMYVNSSTGADTDNPCTVSAAPCATLQRPYDLLSSSYNLLGHSVTVNIADGTYTSGLNAKGGIIGQQNANSVIYQGNLATPGNVIINATVPIQASHGAYMTIQGAKLIATGTTNFGDGTCIWATRYGQINFKAIEFAGCATAGIGVFDGGLAINTGDITISGGGVSFLNASNFGNLKLSDNNANPAPTVTLTGTPAFSGQFALATSEGLIHAPGVTFTGSATGVRYTVILNSLIKTNGGGANYFPGNSAGSTATGGQYN